MHSRALARTSQYRWGGKACFARGMGYRPRYVWRGVSCARRWFVLPVIPRIRVQGHQACVFRGFRSPGSAWRNGKQERGFLAQNWLFVHLCASKINAGICVSFSLSCFYSIACVVGIKMCVFVLVFSGEFGAGIVARRWGALPVALYRRRLGHQAVLKLVL